MLQRKHGQECIHFGVAQNVQQGFRILFGERPQVQPFRSYVMGHAFVL